MNMVMLIGNVGRDPESRSFQNGGKVVNLRVATSETWKDRNSGERKEKTEWHSVAIFNEGLANVAERYVRKGSKVSIVGKLATRKWQDKDGQDRYSTEVVLQGFDAKLILLNKVDGDGGGGGGDYGGSDYGGRSSGGSGGSRGGSFNGGAQSGFSRGGFADDLDDDVPF